MRFAQCQFIKLGGKHGSVAALAFVYRQINGARALAQTVGNNFVLRSQPGAAVHQKHDGVGLIDSLQSLLRHFVQNAAVHNRLKAAGINDEIRFAADFAVSVVAVAGQAGQVVHKRVFGARQAVEQSGFADVRAADKGDGGFHDEVFLCQVSVRNRTCNTSRCFSKHGRLKRMRGRLKIDSTATMA